MSEELEEREYSPRFGQSYINVYLPREEDTGLINKHVPPPSPVFTMSNIYKFSDDVIKDRHLFLGKKAFYHRYVKGEQRRHGHGGSAQPVQPGGTSPDPSEEEKDDECMNVNVVRLALNASSKEDVDRKAKQRFNERLSAYVTTQKKIKSAQNQNSLDGSKTPGASSTTTDTEQENMSFQTILPLTNPNSPRRPRRELSFRTVSCTNITTPRLPTLERAKTYTVEGYLKERAMWFPETASWGSTSAPGQSRMPIRPSSKPHNIWRQSTEFLLGRKTPSIKDITGEKILYPQRTSNSSFARAKSLA
ncbi:hypothetical protein KP79_PYT06002 [Mizuhopecten yessoensis]|uniref:Uncharacterized protein n=1 Tax=Mizuhopecten yessoensis TaxID=6573 RepID=A0A210PMW0_MIZYE|nr:hypothetical protein KP79_PYT06002 [Mizuhopecten yessoensis]